MTNKKNRGVALVTVILAMAIVMVLGVSILYATYTGLIMRTTARTSANTFYDAESVLNEIVAGIEDDMSEQYINAYTKVMENYGNLSSVSDMNTLYKSEFVLNMVDILHMPATATTPADDSKYSTATLGAYVENTYDTGCTWAVSFDTTRAGANMIETLEDGLILRNIKVDFTKGNFKDSITTDIKISIPEVQFAKIASMPEITGYAYIADSGVDIGGGVTLTLSGAAYSGNTMTAAGTGSNTSVMLNSGAVLDAENSNLVIANGDVIAEGGASVMTGASETASTQVTSLWAENLVAQKSSTGTSKAENNLSLLGRTYVADDITLDGSGNTLTLGGQVYLYSSGTDAAADSSALIINGASSVLDMSALDTFVVAGNAFVKASSVSTGRTNSDGSETTNDDIITGDSVALKANQYAYMVPSECKGITTNPLSYTQYNELVEDDDWMTTALTTNLSSIGRSISSYGNVTIVPVFSEKEGGTVYLYLKFSDVSEAALYFMDVYESSGSVGTKVRSYMDNYLTGVKFNATAEGVSNLTRLVTNGTYLKPASYDSNTDTWTAEYSTDADSAGVISQELGNYAKNYAALCTKLVTSSSSLSSADSTRTVFNNLIDTGMISNTTTEDDCLLDVVGATGATLTNASVETISGVGKKVIFNSTDSSGYQAVIVDNAGNDAFTVSSADSSLTKKGILIATGDVTVSDDWDGVILCGGTLNVIGDVDLTNDDSATTSALKLSCTVTSAAGVDSTFTVLNLFRGGENYSLASNTTNPDAEDMTDVRNCIAFENWTAN